MRNGEKARRDRDATRDIGAEVLQAIREVKAGKGKAVAVSMAAMARQESGMSQAKFADMLGVSARTLQQWEQGRRQPTGAARVLIEVARRHPKVVQAAATASRRCPTQEEVDA
jgi:putative transcriptional regulator